MNTKMMTLTALALATTVAFAAPSSRSRRAAAAVEDEDAPTSGRDAKITLDQFPKLGRAATLAAPAVPGGSVIGKCYTKPRSWIVLETKYTTYAKWQDQLTFTWHVLLETKTAPENKGNKEGLAPYSYFTTSVTYQNIPQGSHAASVCLHPSYLERFGEPKAVGLVITNAKGETLAGNCESTIQLFHHPKSLETAFWNNQDIMNKSGADGKPMIERRQGLMDRSKTIWALVNPNDYEQVAN